MRLISKRIIVFWALLFIILIVIPTSFSQFVNLHQSSALENEAQIDDSWERWCRDTNNNRLDDILDEKLLAGEKDSVNIYINYVSQPAELDIEFLEIVGINISYRAKYIPTICARNVQIEIIPELLTNHKIAMIEQQPFIRPLLDVSAGSVKARDSVEYSPETAWELGYTGRDIVIAILDSGVDDRHESLDNKFIAGYDCTPRVPRETNPDDEDGHGTHVAGIAMGTGGDEGNYIGIAPNAQLVDVKVISDWGLTPGDQVIMGIEWCLDVKDQYDIRILSMSVGEMFTGNDDGSGTHGQLVDSAVEEGLVIVVAAGNDGDDNDGFGGLAAAEGAITVGSIDEQESVTRTDDTISVFSNRGPRADDGDEDVIDEYKPDVVAPGESIMSALFSSTPVGLVTGYQQNSGTSMACPHVAGLVALMLEANPLLSPEQVKQILHDTSEARGNPYHSVNDPKYSKDYGWGMVDAFKAVKMVVGEDYQTLNVESHDNNDEVYGSITIYGIVEISSGSLEKVEYKIDLNDWEVAEGIYSWEFQWDTTSVNNGLHTIYLRSFDGIEYSNEFSLTLNVINIGCLFSTPLNGSSLQDTTLITGTSFGQKIREVFIKIDNDEWILTESQVIGGNFSTWEYSWNTKSVSNGKHTISIKAFNGQWYSNVISIEVSVSNSESGGFLTGFDWSFILIGILILLIIKHKRKSPPET
jgi:serine protease AprX